MRRGVGTLGKAHAANKQRTMDEQGTSNGRARDEQGTSNGRARYEQGTSKGRVTDGQGKSKQPGSPLGGGRVSGGSAGGAGNHGGTTGFPAPPALPPLGRAGGLKGGLTNFLHRAIAESKGRAREEQAAGSPLGGGREWPPAGRGAGRAADKAGLPASLPADGHGRAGGLKGGLTNFLHRAIAGHKGRARDEQGRNIPTKHIFQK